MLYLEKLEENDHIRRTMKENQQEQEDNSQCRENVQGITEVNK